MNNARRSLLAATLMSTALGPPLLRPARAASTEAGAASTDAGAAPIWPQRPVRILVGFPPGSSPDVTARILAEPLSRAFGQPVVVENRAGASGNIAADLVAKATDDHTLGIVINGNLTSSKQLFPKLPFDPATAFTDLSLLATSPLVLVAGKNLPAGEAFFRAAVAAGDRWSYGSVGVGSVGHLGVEWLKSRVPGFTAVHVPYQGNPQILTDLIGGQIQFALVPPGLALPQARADKLQAIGLTAGRSALAPEVPPLSDFGIRDFNLEVWNALIGPAALSAPAQRRVIDVVATVIRDPATREQLASKGWQAVGTSPEGMRRRVAEETKIMSRIIALRGITVD